LHCPFRYWPQSPLARRASRVEAVQTTDKLLLTVRDQLGVDQDAQMLKTIAH
jgi:hypothetical protein